MALYRLRVELDDITPTVWRDLVVPGSFTLDRLHDVLSVAMEWFDQHLHMFEIDGIRYGEPSPEGPQLESEFAVRLDSVAKSKSRFRYTYDFGDDWRHTITVTRTYDKLPNDILAPVWCPIGEQASPPEDVGGPPGYERFRAALSDPSHPEHDQWREWSGVNEGEDLMFDPAWVDIDAINIQLLRYIRWTWKPTFDYKPFLP